MILCLIGIFLFTTSLVLAKQGKGAGKKGDAPYGFTKGNKTGWQGSDTPPGWDKGKYKNKDRDSDSDSDRDRDKDSDKDKHIDRDSDRDRNRDNDRDRHRDLNERP